IEAGVYPSDAAAGTSDIRHQFIHRAANPDVLYSIGATHGAPRDQAAIVETGQFRTGYRGAGTPQDGPEQRERRHQLAELLLGFRPLLLVSHHDCGAGTGAERPPEIEAQGTGCNTPRGAAHLGGGALLEEAPSDPYHPPRVDGRLLRPGLHLIGAHWCQTTGHRRPGQAVDAAAS